MIYIFLYNVVAIKADFTKLIHSKKQKMILIGSDYCLERLSKKNRSCFEKIHKLSGRDFHEVGFDEIEKIVLPYIKKHGAQNIRLLTNEDSTQLTCARLREKYDIPGCGVDQILPFVNKVVSKQRLDGIVRIPKFIKFDKQKYLEDKEGYIDSIIKTLGFPMFAKPVDLASSIETHYIPGLSKLETIVNRIFNSEYEFEIDEFISGDIYPCDVFVENKEIKFVSVTKCSNTPAKYPKGVPLGIIQVIDKDIINAFEQFSKKILKKLGVFNGVYHIEAFLDKESKDLIFLEIAARAGGALMPKMCEKCYGLHTEEVNYLLQMGFINDIKATTKNIFAASIVFPKMKGEVAGIVKPDVEIEHKFSKFVHPGEMLLQGQNLLDMAANIIFWDKSYQKVHDTFERLKTFHPLTTVSAIPTLGFPNAIHNILFNEISYIFWKDINGIYYGGNSNEAKILNFNSPQEFTGKTIFEIIDDYNEASIIDDNDNRVMLENRSDIVEEKITGPNGTRTYYSQKIPIRDNNGDAIGMLGFSLDITEIKQKEEASRKVIDLLFDNIPFVFWKNIDGVYQGANLNEAITMGFKSPNEMIGKTTFEVTSDKEAAKLVNDNDNKVMRENRSMIVEETIVGPNGPHTYYSQKTPIRDEMGKVTGMLGFSMDITEHKRTVEKLRIEKEAAELSSEIKTQFIQNMEHDLRTPASGVAQILKFMAEDETNPEKKTTLQQLANASQRLLDLLNGILEFDKMSTGQTAIASEKFDLYDIVNSIIQLETPTATNKKLKLHLDIAKTVPRHIICDKNRVFRILLNLVGNAVKFTSKGYVKIAIDVAKQVDTRQIILGIVVEDTGIGIPYDRLHRIYERFERCTPANKGLYPGSGLGLSITKQFIDELGGEISAKSTEGEGSTFTCLLPCGVSILDLPSYDNVFANIKSNAKTQPVEPTKIPNAVTTAVSTATKTGIQDSFAGVKILVVEDDEIAQISARSVFESKLATDFALAKTGKEALEMAGKNNYDIIFMDIGLPDIAGTEVTSKIRKTNKKIPIIALTAHDKQNTREACQNAGMNDYITKPLDIDKAQFMLQKWLGKEMGESKVSAKPSPEDILKAFQELKREGHIPKAFQVETRRERSQVAEHTTRYVSNEASSQQSRSLKGEGYNNKILDFALCTGIADNNEDTARQLWQVFANLLPKYLEDIQTAYKKKDVKLLFALSHKLKGAAMYAGASRLQIATSDLCEATRSGKTKIDAVKTLYQTTCKEISAVMNKYKELGY